MRVRRLHGWQVTGVQALDMQRRLAKQVSRNDEITIPRFIAGVDISAPKVHRMATGAVVVVSYPELELKEIKVAQGELNIPYIPGLLSFREVPLLLAVCKKLTIIPDLIMVDGQGIAHPRRMGLASHLGLFLNTSTIGCAKSRLCGSHRVPGDYPGDYAELIDKGETIGAALRTKAKVKPVYISIGHKIDLESAIYWVMECCQEYRLPEPTRLAHLAAGGNLKVKVEYQE